jgi:TRAP-type C4-dicarboxylate transport system permease small subunit
MRLLLTTFHMLNRLALIVAAVSAVMVLAASVAVSYGVFTRNLFETSTIWELEASVYAVMFATFLAAAYTDTSGGQVSVGGLSALLPPKVEKIRQVVVDFLAFLLFLAVLVSGWTMFEEAYSYGWRSDTIWGPPLWIPFAAIPLGSLLICLMLALRVVIRLLGGDVDTPRPREH